MPNSTSNSSSSARRRASAATASTWVPAALLRQDMDFQFRVQQWRHSCRFRHTLDVLTSPHPLHDFSVVVWIVLVVALPFVGYSLLWRFVLSFFTCLVTAGLLRAKTPRDVDPRITSQAQVSPNGSPVVELALAVVIFGSVAQAADAGAAVPLAVAFVIMLALKVYSTSYFVHQMAGSVLFGAVLLWVATAVQQAYFHRRMSSGLKLGLGFCGGMLFVGYVAMKIEQNEAPILRVPKREYMRVLGDIMNGSETVAGSNGVPVERRQLAGRRDSFVNLMRSMEQRSFDSAASRVPAQTSGSTLSPVGGPTSPPDSGAGTGLRQQP